MESAVPNRRNGMVEQKIKAVPHRLTLIYKSEPLYFVTFNTMFRKPLLANENVMTAFCDYARKGVGYNVGVGCFVLMPDHIHLFVRITGEITLSSWIKGLKHCLGAVIRDGYQDKMVWQPGFFDHVMRSDEGYMEKWAYVRMNPVRKGLVGKPEDWPYQGEIVSIDRA